MAECLLPKQSRTGAASSSPAPSHPHPDGPSEHPAAVRRLPGALWFSTLSTLTGGLWANGPAAGHAAQRRHRRAGREADMVPTAARADSSTAVRKPEGVAIS